MGQEQVGIAGVTIQDMSGGLNSNILSTEIEDRDGTDAENVYYFDGFLKKMFGITRVNDQLEGAGGSEKVNGIHDFQMRDATQHLVVILEDAIYNRSGTTWADITGALTISDAKHQLITFNDIVIATNLSDDPIKWTGTGNAAALGGSPPKGQWLTSFNGRVCIGNAKVGASPFPARVYYSDLDLPESWDTTDDFWEFEADDGQFITGILPLGQRLIVYKSDSIGVVSGYGLTSWTVDRSFKKGVGCISGYTLKSARIFVQGVMKEVHIFLGEDGLYAFDGSEVIRLSDKAKDFLKSQNTSRFPNAVGSYYKPLDQYYCFFSSSGSSQNDAGLIYDTRKGGIWPLDNINANYAAIVENSTTDIDELHVGSNDSIVYRFDEAEETIEFTTELITNGSMEADANWTDFGSPTTNERSATQARNGSFSRRAVTDAVNEGFYQDITTVVGQRYRVWAHIWVASGDARLAKQDTDGSDAVNGTTQSAAAFTRDSIDFTATATTSRIIFESVGTAVSEFFVDDVSSRRIDIDGFWDSKWFDLGDSQEVKILRELIMFAKTEGDFNVQARVRRDFSTGSGGSSNFNLQESGAIYGTGVYGTGVYGGQTQRFDDLESIAQNEFRFIQVRFRNQSAAQPFEIEKFIIDAKPIGRRFVHNAA